MSLLKALFKIAFKWLFSLMASVEPNVTASRNGRTSGNGSRPQGEQHSDLSPENVLCQLKKTVSEFEEALTRKANQMAEGPLPQQANSQDLLDMNDLRAELAELKADIRGLKRMMTSNSESHGDNAGE